MSEESTTEVAEAPESVESIDNADGSISDAAYAEAQGFEIVTDDQLRGEETEEESAEEEKTEDKAKETEEKSEEKEEDTKEEKSTESKAEELTASSESTEKPPKGFVPLAAVKEARAENRYVKEQNLLLQQQLVNMQNMSLPKVEDELQVEDDFKVLSDDDFKDLAEDDAAEALVYMQKLNVFQENQRVNEAHRVTEQQNVDITNDIMSNAQQAMEKAVPGIFDEDSEAQSELVTFAEDLGFNDDMFYLTNPATKIILPGETEALLLGDQAADILSVLTTARTKISEATTKVDEKAIEARIRKEVEAELVAKFKSKDSSFRSLSDVPKTNDLTDSMGDYSGKVLSDTQFAKLSSVEQEKYLSGE